MTAPSDPPRILSPEEFYSVEAIREELMRLTIRVHNLEQAEWHRVSNLCRPIAPITGPTKDTPA